MLRTTQPKVFSTSVFIGRLLFYVAPPGSDLGSTIQQALENLELREKMRAEKERWKDGQIMWRGRRKQMEEARYLSGECPKPQCRLPVTDLCGRYVWSVTPFLVPFHTPRHHLAVKPALTTLLVNERDTTLTGLAAVLPQETPGVDDARA
ncbi:hypothetical protein RRG08_015983 [Elysia crispata]|uniref:Uncharacterized protein n=1 Tax=Elysia crispata TaxID=231223 RepID=A0AAE1CWL4_9GAST|nr:hypothetical protein RRG08_015983 [Elysia crispata]